jgi:hypothetical protein
VGCLLVKAENQLAYSTSTTSPFPLVEDLSHFGQEFLTFLVECSTFIEVALVRVELLNNLLDATHPIVDFDVFCHG